MLDFRYRRKNVSEEKGMRVEEIPIELIEANPEQPRKIFKPEQLEELAASIKEYGVLQPVLLNKDKNGKYLLIAGERRFRASQLAGIETIPAIVKVMDEKETSLIALVENVQRENLNFIEEAQAYKKLMDEFNLTQVEIAEKVGKQQSTISNKIRILSLPEDVQEAITENNLTERHARALLKLNEEEDRRNVLKRVVKNNLNVKQTEKLIEEVLEGRMEQRRKERTVGYISYKIYVNTIKKAFSQIKEVEKNATISQTDQGDYMEVKITIPKNDRCFT